MIWRHGQGKLTDPDHVHFHGLTCICSLRHFDDLGHIKYRFAARVRIFET